MDIPMTALPMLAPEPPPTATESPQVPVEFGDDTSFSDGAGFDQEDS